MTKNTKPLIINTLSFAACIEHHGKFLSMANFFTENDARKYAFESSELTNSEYHIIDTIDNIVIAIYSKYGEKL